jgi:hypothetical protein
MQLVIAIISVLGAAGVIVFTSPLDIGGGVKAVIVALVVLIAVYSMARIQPKATNPEEDTGK